MRTLFVLLLAAGALLARVIVVPDSAATVQAGLNLAGYGDTVLVMPGTYTENIVWPSTDGIRLHSLAGPDSTVLSGGGNGRVLQFGSAQSRATELRGFTVRAGKASAGAGIYCGGSPAIVGNLVSGNTAQGGRDYGAGIYVAANCSPLIRENEISDNVAADSSTWVYGGGIHAASRSSPEICFNLIARNECRLGYWTYGAGIYIDDAPALVYGNVITANSNKDGDRGHGAGIYVGGPALIFCNLITANENRGVYWNYGAGIKVNGPAAIIANTISSNACIGGNFRQGGGIFVDINETAYVKNNIIASNSAASGGGIFCYSPGGVATNSFNNVWNNTGGDYVNCTPGPGAISADPLFVAGGRGAFYLSQTAAGQPSTSPSVDAGDTLLPALGLDLESLLRSWTTRTDSIPDTGPLDMGFHYLTSLQVGLNSPVSRWLPLSVQAGPSPTRGVVRFTAGPIGRESVELTVTDALGRVVHRSTARGARLEWDGRAAPAGVYTYRLTAAGRTAAGQIVRLP